MLSACKLFLAGSNSKHVAAIVTGWMSPQHGQIWCPGGWWDPSPRWVKTWHIEYSCPLSSGCKHTHTHTRSGHPYIEMTHTCQIPYILTRHRGRRIADWSWCSSTLCLCALASYWTLCSIFLVQNHADLCTHAQMKNSHHTHCSLSVFLYVYI